MTWVESRRRILAVDWGKRRIGLAVCDELGLTVRGLPTLVRTNQAADVETLAEIASREEAGSLVVGRPLNMNGSAGKSAAAAERFGRLLAQRTGLEVAYVDERLTSREAEARLRETGRRPTKADIDRVSAEIILQTFLAAREQETPA